MIKKYAVKGGWMDGSVALTMKYSELYPPVWEVSVYYALSEHLIDLTGILMQNSFSPG